jgi:hypothetical protein
MDVRTRAGKGKKIIKKVYADYEGHCENCGTSPVVSLTGLCGPCTFGEAACADPAEWEGDYEFTEKQQ